MGEFTDKLDAAGNKIIGNIKEAVGKATGNAELEAKGDLQQLKGAAQQAKADVKHGINKL